VQPLSRSFIIAIVFQNLKSPLIVRVTLKSLASISTHFKVVLCLGYWGLLVVRVNSFGRRHMLQSDIIPTFHVFQRIRDRPVSPLNNPVIVGVLVRIKRDLLLYVRSETSIKVVRLFD